MDICCVGPRAAAFGLTVYQTSFGQEQQSDKGCSSLPMAQPQYPSAPEEMLPSPQYCCCAQLSSGYQHHQRKCAGGLPAKAAQPPHSTSQEVREAPLSLVTAELAGTTLLPPTAHPSPRAWVRTATMPIPCHQPVKSKRKVTPMSLN